MTIEVSKQKAIQKLIDLNMNAYRANCKKLKKHKRFVQGLIDPDKCEDFYKSKKIACRYLKYSFEEKSLTNGAIEKIFKG